MTPPSLHGADRVSVIIPAHDEAGVIGRCLGRLLEGAHPGELDVVVVCNGCSDGTADVVRSAWPGVRVVELSSAGKARALNAGDEVAATFPRVYLDADVEVTVEDVRLVAQALRSPDVLCAAPKVRFAVEDRPWVIRKFYEAWIQLPYLNDAMVGSGFFALSAEGRRRFSSFPEDLVADDQFVLDHFAPGERASVAEATFVVHPPRRLRSLIAVRTRAYRGNRQLTRRATTPERQVSRRAAVLRLARPGTLTALAVYAGVNLLAEARSRRAPGGWERDESGRGPGGDRPSADQPTGVRTTDHQRHRIGYVVSRYPSVSHTFVLREVRAGRSAGLDIRTFTVKRARPEEVLSAVDRDEAASTWAVRPRPWLQLLAPHLRLVLHHPATWAGVLGWSLRRGAPGLRGRLWQVFYFGEAVILAAECRRQGVRHLHAHHANVAADLAWIAAELGGRLDGPGTWAWTLTFHGSSELAEVRRIRLPEKLASAAKVLCVADHTRAQLLPWVDDADWGKLVVVHTGADLQRYRPAAVADRSADRPAEILCVGRIDPVKGYPLLIDAVARLREEDVDCRLTIVGGGHGADRLERRVRDRGLEGRVRLLGAVGQDELPALYREADVFCLPSFTESLPVVLMEAMASGLPVVATRVAAIPELVRDGESGLLVAPGRTDLLAGALRRLITEPAVRAAMGRAGRAAVEAGFDADACGRRAAAELAEVARRLRPVARSE